MKKMKTLLLTLALSCTFAAAMAAVGCGDDNAQPATSTDSSVNSSVDTSVDSSDVDTSVDSSDADSSVDSSDVDSSVDSSDVDSSVDSSDADSSVDSSDANSSVDDDSNWFDDEESLVSVRFATSYVEVKQYENYDLGCVVKGTTSAAEFTSSDETVATVDANGVVTTYGVLGEATITAKVEGVEATCVVKVTETSYAPVIVLNSTEYTIEKGETLEFTVSSEWNNTELTEDVEYAVSFADASQEATAEISVEGNVIKVVAGDVAESFDIIISATIRGIYTNTSVTVNVISGALKLQPVSSSFVPADGKYTAQMYTTSQVNESHVDNIPLSFAVMKDNEVIEDAEINWSVETIADERTLSNAGKVQEAAKIEEGVLVAVRRGSVKVTGTVEVDGETATVEVECEIIPPEVHFTQTQELEVANLKTLVIEEPVIGKLERAEFNGTKVSSVVVGKSIQLTNYVTAEDKENKTNPLFPSSAKELGRKQLVIYSDLVRYTMDVDVYTMIINDADELDQMREVAHTGETEWNSRYNMERSSEYYDGYFVLGNDIDYNREIKSMTDTGSVWWCQGVTDDHTRGFKGIFDGRGFNIDGVTVGDINPSGDRKQSGGIFGYVSKEGVVKNVSFTNAVLGVDQGFICSMGDGTIENVSISYKKIGGNKETESINSETPRTMGSFFSYKSGTNATVRNCLIDASAADITEETGWYNGTKKYNLKLMGTAKNVSNVVVICPNQKVLETSGADVQKLNYVEMTKESELFDKFDKTIWTTVENVPMFVKQAENLDVNAEVGFVNAKDSLVAGFEMLIIPSNPYVKIELEEMEGVTFENSLLKATEAAFTKTVTLTVTSLFNPEITAQHRVYIDSFGTEVETPASPTEIAVYPTNNILEIGDNSWMGEENYVYMGADIISAGNGAEKLEIDLSKLEWGYQDVTVVSVKNGVREHFDVELRKWFESADFATSELVSDSAFHATTRFNGEYHLYDNEAIPEGIKQAEGYEKIDRLDSYVQWSTALSREFFDATNLSGYSDIWFGVGIINGRFISQGETIPTAWVYFHYVQISDGVWVAEVTIDGSVYKTEFDVTGTTLREMLYRGGWATGFLWYNNNQGEGAVSETVPTSLYATEIRGVKKA